MNEKNQQVQVIQKEINQLSDEAKNNFYPIDGLSFTDYFKMKNFMKKLDSLPEKDRQLGFGYDDMNQAYATAKSQFVKVVIAVVFVILVLVLLVVLSIRRKKRKQAKLEKYMMVDDEEYDDE